jgi:hypothetical protein
VNTIVPSAFPTSDAETFCASGDSAPSHATTGGSGGKTTWGNVPSSASGGAWIVMGVGGFGAALGAGFVASDGGRTTGAVGFVVRGGRRF